jgi:ElaB/YqjD/DUF883 family membrane-anchored ribosome-binding protein
MKTIRDFPKFQEAQEQLTEASRVAAKKVDRELHKNPWAFVAAASLFGLLLGFILGNSRRRS